MFYYLTTYSYSVRESKAISSGWQVSNGLFLMELTDVVLKRVKVYLRFQRDLFRVLDFRRSSFAFKSHCVWIAKTPDGNAQLDDILASPTVYNPAVSVEDVLSVDSYTIAERRESLPLPSIEGQEMLFDRHGNFVVASGDEPEARISDKVMMEAAIDLAARVLEDAKVARRQKNLASKVEPMQPFSGRLE